MWYAPQEFMAAMVVIAVIAMVVAARAARRLRRGIFSSAGNAASATRPRREGRLLWAANR